MAPTFGAAFGYLQTNLVMLTAEEDFTQFNIFNGFAPKKQALPSAQL
jgi:hypothetical protein